MIQHMTDLIVFVNSLLNLIASVVGLAGRASDTAAAPEANDQIEHINTTSDPLACPCDGDGGPTG